MASDKKNTSLQKQLENIQNPLEKYFKIHKMLSLQMSPLYSAIEKINNTALMSIKNIYPINSNFQNAISKINDLTNNLVPFYKLSNDVFKSQPFIDLLNTIYNATTRFTDHKDTCDAVSRLGYACAVHGHLGFFSKSEDDDGAKRQIYAYAKSKKFEYDLLNIVACEDRISQRYDIIKTAICMHRLGNYHISSMISSSQIEGILHDCLKDLGLIYYDGKYSYATCECGDICKTTRGERKKLMGLDGKINHAKDKSAISIKFIDDMLSDNIDKDSSINEFRNKLMHGDCDCEPTEVESLKLLLWMFGMTLRVCVALSDSVYSPTHGMEELD